MTGRARALQSMRSHREQLSAFAQRSKEVLLLAAGLGAITGLVVGVFERVVVDGIDRVNAAPLWVGATMPFVGLAVAALCLRWIGRRISPATADEYLLAFHDPQHELGLRALVARMLAAIATLGSGCPMGLEGPSLYSGAALGDRLHRRLPRLFSAQNRRVLLVAGAAAGVAAIFKAPATGAVFALEVPYQDDLARRMLLPALVASASGYLTFVALHGTAPLLPVFGTAPFSTKDLVGAVIVGLLAGLGARVFSHMIRASKRIADRVSPWWRVPAAGASIALFFVASRLLTGRNLATGTGYDTIRWALVPSRGLWIIGALLLLRCLGTASTVAGGGVGGLFIPLVVAGALVGASRRRRVQRARQLALHRHRCRRVPRRRLPRAARGGDVRGRGHRPARFRRPRFDRGGRLRAPDGTPLGHDVSAPARRGGPGGRGGRRDRTTTPRGNARDLVSSPGAVRTGTRFAAPADGPQGGRVVRDPDGRAHDPRLGG